MGGTNRQQYTIPVAVIGMLVAIGSVRIASEQAFWIITAVFLAGLLVLGTLRLMWLSNDHAVEDDAIAPPPMPARTPTRVDGMRISPGDHREAA